MRRAAAPRRARGRSSASGPSRVARKRTATSTGTSSNRACTSSAAWARLARSRSRGRGRRGGGGQVRQQAAERQAHRHPVTGRSSMRRSKVATTITSAAPATWANCGLYSIPVTAGSRATIARERVAHLAEQPLDRGRRSTPLSISVSGRMRLVGVPGAAEHVVDAGHRRHDRDLQHPAGPACGSAVNMVRYVEAPSESTYSA